MRAFQEQVGARPRSPEGNHESQKAQAAQRLHAAQQAELRGARQRLMRELELIYTAFKRWLQAERRVVGLGLFDFGLRLVGYAALALPALALSVVASLLAMASVRRGLQQWTDGAWWADFALALGVLALLPGFALLVRRRVHRSALRSLREAFGESGASTASPAAPHAEPRS